VSLPDGAEYWWDVKGYNKPSRKFPPKHGVRRCPKCGLEVQCIKHGKRYWKIEHPGEPLPSDFPLVAPMNPTGRREP